MTEITYDFDTPIDRRLTASLKWDRYKDPDVLPMWVADMDFKSPPQVIQALHERVDHGIFGYSRPPASLVENTLYMLKDKYQWNVRPEWLVWLPGLVTGLNVCCRAVGQPGDDIMTAVPVYPPFLTAPVFQGKILFLRMFLYKKMKKVGISILIDWKMQSLPKRVFLFYATPLILSVAFSPGMS